MLAIINGRILNMTNRVIEEGTVLVESGKIVKVGSKVEIPADADIIDVEIR
ncbi:hypothetical protein MWH25_00210 [Natroniella acetigena]|uniref:hypothetical protein n=1 Tax=Natroniella acetigena TaxID=52004 RepID=UPI00200AC1EE|nr:hypothetical protein [Natroniella acetigena]MCK8826170.1 hypothetical protein [Natroniella acetigena]